MLKRFAALALLVACMAAPALAAGEKYEANWTSLDKRPTPAWFQDAKFGIFIHWGLYSVPGWAPKGKYAEWYWKNMETEKKKETLAFHNKTYGEKFKYQDFAPMFKAEMFDPAEWADIFQRAGAKYIVLTSKHHEGFCLWPNPQAWNWNSVDVGPHRDLCKDLTDAVKAKGLKMGFYYSLYEWYNPLYKSDMKAYVSQHMIPQIKDLVTRYQPSILWTDGEWEHPSQAWKAEEALAWLFNDSPVKDEVAINDRWGKETRGVHGGYYTTEYFKVHGKEVSAYDRPWEECRGIGASFGVNRNENLEDYQSRDSLVKMLVEIVSRGGNLLLDIGPNADGTIPVIMEERLLQLGEWLKANGEAVYGTQAGPLKDLGWGRTTAKGNKLYVHILDWPKDNVIKLAGLKGTVKSATMLADAAKTPLKLDKAENALTIHVLPEFKDTAATVVALELE
jgi:alpha-L-fucosidase